jgi:ABC-type antimicrobial peptide transport system permease subunit
MYSEEFAREMIAKNKESHIAKNINEHGNVTSMSYSFGGIDLDIGIYYTLYYTYYDTNDKVYKENMKKVYVGKNQSGLMSTFMSYIGSASSYGGGAGGAGGSSSGSSLTDLLSNMKTTDINGVAGTYLPSSISIYPNDFNTKYLVTDYLDAWNQEDKVVTFNNYNEDFTSFNGTTSLNYADRNKIKYTDSVEIIINLINTMINIITYALVAFTALALIVSTVMVAIITYVSVVERIKEIGVIRALGGRKKDVSHLFNAETFVIGLASGIFGIAITGIISVLGNVLIKVVSQGQVSSIAHLTPLTAIIMILLSVVLTSIAGLIPAKSAARKDPVVALRTE